jgi:alkanesulfonate monooxygenase SsuD/methylene tetrahydromethanopterin reductase-like flavin-dependent oxidoreductase (luciferase family)
VDLAVAMASTRLMIGRMILGLGTSVRTLDEEIYGVIYGKPIGHLREVTAMVRAVIEKGHTGKW